ncbi:MAG: aldehyde dehydrogenase family protein [Gammaproteobacteria bacterium]|nr:aldehyde dehydrogenase family protein [Gammaproteobacteria bacterium]MYB37373.1 aldehyde dehydrogenase family protein [Gammaproteobacteria bacterium]
MTNFLVAANPRGGEGHRFAAADPAAVDDAAGRLRAAHRRWAARSVEERSTFLARWRNALDERRGEIVAALIEDTGRALLSEAEVDGALRRIDYWCGAATSVLAERSVGMSATVPSVRFEHRLVPFELVGVVAPWNFPLLLMLIDAVPALAAGCAVLCKPSEHTPRFVEPLMDAVAAEPEIAAVFDCVRGGADTGAAVAGVADAVCFTGSVATGRKVGARAGARLIPAFLELGGKDPLVVLADADVETAAAIALRGSVLATGQACQSIERVYVHETLYAPFVEAIVAAASAVTLNTQQVDRGHLGPFIHPGQADLVEAQLAEAVAGGATLHCGGLQRRNGGAWCAPAVLTGVHHDMRLFAEETFGPVVPVMAFASDDEAVRLANDSEFGLSAAVLGAEEHALAVARRLCAGAVSVNDAGLTTQVGDVEKDSFGVSGVGRSRMGTSGLVRFLRRQALLVQTGPAAPLDAFREVARPRP